MSSWQEYKKRYGATQNLQQNNSSQNNMSSWEKYKKEQEERKRQEAMKKAQEEQKKEEKQKEITKNTTTDSFMSSSYKQSFEERKNSSKNTQTQSTKFKNIISSSPTEQTQQRFNYNDLSSVQKLKSSNQSVESRVLLPTSQLGSVTEYKETKNDAESFIKNLLLGAKKGIMNFTESGVSAVDKTYNNNQMTLSVLKNTNEVRESLGKEKLKIDDNLESYKSILGESNDKDLFGRNKEEQKNKWNSEKNNINTKMILNSENTNTKIGKKLSELAPSIGQQLPGYVLPGGLGLTYFTGSSKGAYMEDAQSRGMSEKESETYSGIMALAEGLTEQLGAGFTKGIGKRVLKGNTKSALKLFGLDIAENFIEEAVMEPISESTATLTGGKETANWDNMSKRMINSGIDGALSSILMAGTSAGIGKAIQVTNKINNNQQVTTQEVSEAVKETLQNKNVNNQELKSKILKNTNKIINEQQNELLKSNISNDNFSRQQTILNKQQTPQNQNMLQTEQSDINMPVKELNYIESARKYNINTNNKTVQSIARVTNERGLKTTYNADIFSNNSQNAIWKINTDGTGNITREVILNPNATDTNRTLQNIIIHELTHDMEGTKQYNELRDIILEYDQTKSGYQEARKSLEELYSKVYDVNSNEFQTLVENETVADILGNKLGDQDFVNNLTIQNRTVGRKIYDWVIDKLNKLNSKIGYKSEKLYWTDVKNKFENAFKQEYSNATNMSKFSIQEDSNGNQYVKVDTDQDIFNGIDKKDYNKIAKMYIQDYLMGETTLSNNDKTIIDGKSASKYANPGKRQDYFNEKMKLTPELKNVLEIAQKDSISAPTKDTSKYQNWEYYKFNFELDGKNFEGTINIGIDKDGNKHFYEINKIHFTGISSVSTNSQHKVDSINNSIALSKKDVNTTNKYSMQDSRNNSKWEEHLNKNYKNTGKGETIRQVKLSKSVQKINQNNIAPVRETLKKETNLEKYNNYKNKIIKGKEQAINNLITYKNDSIRSLDNKISEKEAILNAKVNKDTKAVAILKFQIENLKTQKTKIENLYNERIDKANSKTDREKIELETRNMMKKEARDILKAEITPLVEDLTKYKDKKAGILFNRETAQRNIDDIVADKDLAQSIKETVFDPVQVHQAEKTREINKLYEKINSLDLDKTKKYYYVPEKEISGVKVDEATLAQLIIENKITDKDLRNYGLNDSAIKKVHSAADTFTEILDNLYNRMNEEQIKYGYSPIGKIDNYFPHFLENKPDTMLGKVASCFGIDLTNQNLPTEIAGKTDTFKPGKTWNSNTQKRRTNKTDYNALVAMERYIQGAAEIIYTTEDIQKVREYGKQIRYKYSDKGIQTEIDNIMNNSELTQEAKDLALDGIFKNTENELSNFVTWLDDYANTLAGKKAFSDRNMERNIGRNIYNSMSGIESRIAANTIGGNLSVSLTNFAPIAQAAGTTKWNYLITGMLQTTSNNIKGMVGNKDVSFVNNSNFLTNRFGMDSISKKKVSQKMSDFLSIPMNAIDEFTAESIVRAKYLENIDKGMSEEVALDSADKYAAKIMADRSKGALPVLFNSKNPMSKLITMFQVEPNNIVSNYLKDMPRDANSKTQLTAQATKLMVASYAFNSLIMAVRGGNEVLPDPIRWVSYLIQAITGDDDEKEKAKTDLSESVLGSIPFLSNLAGFIGMEDIGRVPISNAIPNISNLSKLADNEANSKYKSELALKELSKPLLYLGLPVGGAQLKKTLEGVTTVTKGGSYKTNKKGEKELQFAVENPNVGDYIRAGVFGKYSLPDSKLYADRGYKALSAKQTKAYEESKVPYKEYLEYLDQNLTKKEDKLKYLNSKNWTTNQKWGIYKNEILSNIKRKEDGGSQLSDAEYMISHGVSKSEFIKLYNEAQKNNIEIPTKKEYKEMRESGLALKEYIDYTTEVKKQTKAKRQSGELNENQTLKDKDKIQILLDSEYTDEQKTVIYENYILTKTNTTYPLIKATGIDINEYMKYVQQNFESDKIDDGTTSGKTVSGSSKRKVYNYVNSMNITYEQRLMLLGMKYTLNDAEQSRLYNYVKTLDYTQEELQTAFEKLKGFTVYNNGRVTW